MREDSGMRLALRGYLWRSWTYLAQGFRHTRATGYMALMSPAFALFLLHY